MNNYQRLGIENSQDAIKYALAKIYEHRVKILDKGLGGEWKVGKYKHGEIPELREAVFFVGTRQFMLTDKGFTTETEVR